MTEWTLLKRLLDAVHQHSTMIGRLWLTVMVIFRLLVVAVATEDVYADEQQMFVCNTLQPGCPTVCYDAFAPISQPRFWVFHIISVSTPSLCFIVYTWHNLSKLAAAPGRRRRQGAPAREAEPHRPSCGSDSCSVLSHQPLGHSLAAALEAGASGEALAPAAASADGLGVLSRCYVVHVCLRAALELGFVAAQWRLFGLRVPVRFVCSSAPCGAAVDCYVSRPTEKTVFLVFMFCVGVFCVGLNLLELNHLGWKSIRRAVRPREEAPWRGRAGRGRGYQSIPPPSPSPRPSLGPPCPPPLGVAMGQQPHWSCGVNCGGAAEKVGDIGGEGSRGADRSKGRGFKQSSSEVWI